MLRRLAKRSNFSRAISQPCGNPPGSSPIKSNFCSGTIEIDTPANTPIYGQFSNILVLIFFQYFSNVFPISFGYGFFRVPYMEIYGHILPNMAIFGAYFLGCHKGPQLHLWGNLEFQRNQIPPVIWDSKLL